MATQPFDELLRQMPAIAQAVNSFNSESVQLQAFRALMDALDSGHAASDAATASGASSGGTAAASSKKPTTEDIVARLRAEAKGGKKAGQKQAAAQPKQETGTAKPTEAEAQSSKPAQADAEQRPPRAEASEQASKQPKAAKPSPVEAVKEQSNYLRGEIRTQLADSSDHFTKESTQLLKHHGTYQQDDRDARTRGQGKSGRRYIFMVRTKVPGGKLSSQQLLAELDMADRLGNTTLRITSRQGLQLHGIPKGNLHETIRRINEVQLSTLGACGDVNRNVMCCPAPYGREVYRQTQQLADQLADHFAPRTTAYREIWTRDLDSDEQQMVGGGPNGDVVEPIYGRHYLPRKFKMGIAFPHDNCIDIYTHDLGFLAVVEDDQLLGYNVLTGGGLGVTPSLEKTFPALAYRLAFVRPQQALDVATAVVKVQRDFGNRSDRKRARLKYLIHDWGLDKFKAKVEEYFGGPLDDPHPADVHAFNDHMGWEQQGDGRLFYGLNIENGRIADTEQSQLKSAIRELCQTFQPGLRLTSHQSLLFTDLEPDCQESFEEILKRHHVRLSEEFSTVRRWSMACVAWPTCGLSITEAERSLPGVMDEMEQELARYGLSKEPFTVRMTGCPNGCARPYNSDIGLVGKTKGKYTVFVGGRLLGNRLNFLYKDLVPEEEIVSTLSPLFAFFKQERQGDESFGDFCHRQGRDELLKFAEVYTTSAVS